MTLFRRLIILLLFMGANVMLFNGLPGDKIVTGVVVVVVVVGLYVGVLWRKGEKGWVEAWRGRWVDDDVMYTKVATSEEEEEEEEEEDEEEGKGQDDGGGSSSSSSSSGGVKPSGVTLE